MFCVSCDRKELFAPALNQILASSPYVPSMPVVLRPGLNDQSRHEQINKTERNEAKHKHGNSFASLQCKRFGKSIIHITMHKQKALINLLSRSKAPKTQQNADYKYKRKASGLSQ